MSNVVSFRNTRCEGSKRSMVHVDVDDYGIHVRVVPPVVDVNPHVIFWKEYLAGEYVEYLRETYGFAVRWPDEGGAA